jgi:uncharacterized protein
MQVPREALLLRIFTGEDGTFGYKPLYEAIVLKAREMSVACATVLRGTCGIWLAGPDSHVHFAIV